MTNRLDISVIEQFDLEQDVIVLYVANGPELGDIGRQIWASTGLDLLRVAKAGNFSGKPGETLDLVAPGDLDCDRLLLCGMPDLSDQETVSPRRVADLGGALMGRLLPLKPSRVGIVLDNALFTPAHVAEFGAGLKLRHYRFDHHKTGSNAEEPASDMAITLAFADPGAATPELASRLAVAEGTNLARDLANEAPNHLGPAEFAERIRELTQEGLDVDILSAAELEKLGMGALLAVAKGSSRPAQLAIMRWNGGTKDEPPLAFVGKGVVFDTGGISIKPATNMENMKGDMGGAAAVVGLMFALAKRKAKVNAVGVVGLVENMPDGNAYRPGDILKTMSGQTIEVVNTDAEGRLVLADALWYTQDRFKPKLMIDLATLTGAIMVALGSEYAGLFANNDELRDQLEAAGTDAGEKMWRMPLDPAYDKLIESRFADMKNSGGRMGGASTAAMLLKRFVNDTVWAHIDIAGTGLQAGSTDINTSWAPGFGVQVLDRFVRLNHEAGQADL